MHLKYQKLGCIKIICEYPQRTEVIFYSFVYKKLFVLLSKLFYYFTHFFKTIDIQTMSHSIIITKLKMFIAVNRHILVLEFMQIYNTKTVYPVSTIEVSNFRLTEKNSRRVQKGLNV